SSFDLFLDTVCNTFGGILFIAILIAIQIRQVETPPAPESCSPEMLAQMRQKADEAAAEIESAAVLLEMLRKTLPEPASEEDKNLVKTYTELTEAKNNAVTKKSGLTCEYIAKAQQNAEAERDLKNTEERLRQLEAQEKQLLASLQQLQSSKAKQEQSVASIQETVNDLQNTTSQKEQNVDDRNDPDKNTRQEVLYLPKLHDAGNKQQFGLMMYNNRLYVVLNRSDFIYSGNEVGIPISHKGIPITDTDDAKRHIKALWNHSSPSTHFITIIVYANSVDAFHIVRDCIIADGYKYELIPAPDDKKFYFGGSGGSAEVQ
ncbi:MAG: hypothetical protein LBT89_12670, partial [Planctomycetaceae bacterium]|nr:hypothetical protein [Planctomycetaceae bacterium]